MTYATVVTRVPSGSYRRRWAALAAIACVVCGVSTAGAQPRVAKAKKEIVATGRPGESMRLNPDDWFEVSGHDAGRKTYELRITEDRYLSVPEDDVTIDTAASAKVGSLSGRVRAWQTGVSAFLVALPGTPAEMFPINISLLVNLAPDQETSAGQLRAINLPVQVMLPAGRNVADMALRLRSPRAATWLVKWPLSDLLVRSVSPDSVEGPSLYYRVGGELAVPLRAVWPRVESPLAASLTDGGSFIRLDPESRLEEIARITDVWVETMEGRFGAWRLLPSVQAPTPASSASESPLVLVGAGVVLALVAVLVGRAPRVRFRRSADDRASAGLYDSAVRAREALAALGASIRAEGTVSDALSKLKTEHQKELKARDEEVREAQKKVEEAERSRRESDERLRKSPRAMTLPQPQRLQPIVAALSGIEHEFDQISRMTGAVLLRQETLWRKIHRKGYLVAPEFVEQVADFKAPLKALQNGESTSRPELIARLESGRAEVGNVVADLFFDRVVKLHGDDLFIALQRLYALDKLTEIPHADQGVLSHSVKTARGCEARLREHLGQLGIVPLQLSLFHPVPNPMDVDQTRARLTEFYPGATLASSPDCIVEINQWAYRKLDSTLWGGRRAYVWVA